jgi:nitrogenase subunit NifH
LEKQITGKEIRKDMEYLVKLLHKEWERSGKTKAQVTVSLSDAVEIGKRMAGVIHDKQKQLENEELTFQQSMELSKQNFVLLRLVKKVKKAEEKTVKKADTEFFVELDKEEYKLFAKIVGTQEG